MNIFRIKQIYFLKIVSWQVIYAYPSPFSIALHILGKLPGEIKNTTYISNVPPRRLLKVSGVTLEHRPLYLPPFPLPFPESVDYETRYSSTDSDRRHSAEVWRIIMFFFIKQNSLIIHFISFFFLDWKTKARQQKLAVLW